MPLILPKCCVLLIPRAGSTWIRQAIRHASISYSEHGPKHATEIPNGAPKFVLAFTREPEAWALSRWVLGPWQDELTQFWDKDYATFRGRVTDAMVQMYFGKYTQKATFVGKQESLCEDLINGLTQAGEKFDPELIRATPKYNVTDHASQEVITQPAHPKNQLRFSFVEQFFPK